MQRICTRLVEKVKLKEIARVLEISYDAAKGLCEKGSQRVIAYFQRHHPGLVPVLLTGFILPAFIASESEAHAHATVASTTTPKMKLLLVVGGLATASAIILGLVLGPCKSEHTKQGLAAARTNDRNELEADHSSDEIPPEPTESTNTALREAIRADDTPGGSAAAELSEPRAIPNPVPEQKRPASDQDIVAAECRVLKDAFEHAYTLGDLTSFKRGDAHQEGQYLVWEDAPSPWQDANCIVRTINQSGYA